MAPDGGLYVPETWPTLNFSPRTANGHYVSAAVRVLEAFGASDLDDLVAVVTKAYIDAPSVERAEADDGWVRKWPECVTPLRQIGVGKWLLELFHGPSLSFKDVAMQLIGPLYDLALARGDQRASVVCATSGDTGGAAVEALKNSTRADLFVLTPKGRVSEVQRRFMTTSGAENVHVMEVDGDFDACQAIVKAMFADAAFAAQARLSGVNSINWARIVAQSVYYHMAAQALCASGPVNFVAPTGNFGDAYSGWVAKQTGAPIGRIVLATNANDILTRALRTGRYERRSSQATLSPAMDIQVASNFERILFEALGRDADAVRALYAGLAQSGGFTIPSEALNALRETFDADAVSDEETLSVMRDVARYDDHLVCPHTAVGLWPPHTPPSPAVFLATAHAAKFPETVARATGIVPPLPAKCADLFARAEKFDSIAADAEAVKQYIRERSRAWS